MIALGGASWLETCDTSTKRGDGWEESPAEVGVGLRWRVSRVARVREDRWCPGKENWKGAVT